MFDIDLDISLTRVKKRIEKVLLIAYYDSNGVPSIIENIALVQRLSDFPISILNLAEHRYDTGYLKIPSYININSYDAIIIHNTAAYNVDNLFSLDQNSKTKLRNYSGAKFIMKQDEHYRFGEFVEYAKQTGIDCIFSPMPESEICKTYGYYLPDVVIRPMLTGYVTAGMRKRFNLKTPRPIDIGYRGSIMPLSFGRLCYEKRIIGDDVKRILQNQNLNLNISSRWEDRFGGEAWFEFLSSCKAVLGVESGSGVFDIDGSLAIKCKEIEDTLGPFTDTAEYAESYLGALKPLENNIKYFAISPRHFEAISTGTIQILFPGHYSGRMTAGRHYFELQQDYSNLPEAVELLQDDTRREMLAKTAYEEVLMNEVNWIETFAHDMDKQLTTFINNKGRRKKPLFASNSLKRNVLLLHADDYGLDPRRDHWYSEGAHDDTLIHYVGIQRRDIPVPDKVGANGRLIYCSPLKKWHSECLDHYFVQASRSGAAMAALSELQFMSRAVKLSNSKLSKLLGISADPKKVKDLRVYMKYVLDTAYSHIDTVTRMEGVHAILAVNLASLIPALILKDLMGVPVIYDTLEYWPEILSADSEAGQMFWKNLERRMVAFTDERSTVSSGLANIMGEYYDKPFLTVPNCVPYKDGVAPEHFRADDGAVKFLFQGGFSPNRGIEALIQLWGQVDARAILLLRGPEGEFKEQMRQLAIEAKLCDKSIFFPPPVNVDDLVAAAKSDADIGIIPYPPHGINYSNCSPNKLGQYMAAGLPILANKTYFVEDSIKKAHCGITVNFNHQQDFISAVSRLCDKSTRVEFGRNGRLYFENIFNWESISKPLYNAINEKTYKFKPKELFLFESELHRHENQFPLNLKAFARKSLRQVWRLIPVKLRHYIASRIF